MQVRTSGPKNPEGENDLQQFLPRFAVFANVLQELIHGSKAKFLALVDGGKRPVNGLLQWYCVQRAKGEFFFHGGNGNDRNPQACRHRVLDRLWTPELHGDFELIRI